MTYFQNIHSLADLKKEYRRLALEHHPDKGGDTAIMQQVTTEFGRLFEAWKEKPDIPSTSTGYEYDYPGATAKEYTGYVYNEYRWKGRNYKGQHAPEIVGLVRAWLKETYPGYKFSARREKSSRRCQPPSYPFRQIIDGQGKGCNDEHLRFHHVVQFR